MCLSNYRHSNALKTLTVSKFGAYISITALTVSILDRDFLFCPSLNSLPLSYKDSMGVPWVTHGIPEIPWKAHGFPMEFAIKFHGIDHNSMEGPWAPPWNFLKRPMEFEFHGIFPKSSMELSN